MATSNNLESNDPRPPSNTWRYTTRDVLTFGTDFFTAEPGELGGLESDRRERTGVIKKRERERPRGKNRGAFLYTVAFEDPSTVVDGIMAHGADGMDASRDVSLVTLACEGKRKCT